MCLEKSIQPWVEGLEREIQEDLDSMTLGSSSPWQVSLGERYREHYVDIRGRQAAALS